jgi:hypothetical protein
VPDSSSHPLFLSASCSSLGEKRREGRKEEKEFCFVVFLEREIERNQKTFCKKKRLENELPDSD